MHEMGIANSILDALRTEVRRFPKGHVFKVGIRIGELAGVDPGALSFCFEALVRDTEWEPLNLEIEFTPCRHQCRSCGKAFVAKAGDQACTFCGALDSQFIGGDELELAFLEVEDGACAARR